MNKHSAIAIGTSLTDSGRDAGSLSLLLGNVFLPPLKATLAKSQCKLLRRGSRTHKFFPHRNLIRPEFVLPLPVVRERLLCNLKLYLSFPDPILETLSLRRIDLEIT